MNRTNTLIVLAIAGTGLLAACGGDDGSTPAVAAAPAPAVASVPPATSTTIAAAAGSTVAVKSAESDLGPILVGVDGRTLYGFTNDTPTQSNCEGTCAEAWPPVVVPANWTVAPGVDSGIFNTITRPDGTLQLVAGKYPLYAYSGDTAPGDVNGQGSGDVWFVVDTAGALIEGDAATETTDVTETTENATTPRERDDRDRRRQRGAAQGRVHRRDPARRGAHRRRRIHALRLHQGRRRPPDMQRRLRRRVATVAGRRRHVARGSRRSRVQHRPARRRVAPAEGRQVAVVPVRR